MTNPTVHHEGLGTTFRGVAHSLSTSEQEIWQFRGIKYATIPARFVQSVANTTFPEITDATRYGPKAPQLTVPTRLEDALIGLPPEIASHAEDIFDEFECLNLNITTPRSVTETSSLPVLVYVHGGGGFSGSNSDWWCDGGSIVKKSVEIGRPVIMVAINYRVSALGNIGSSTLQTENGIENGGNFGLRDIQTALSFLSRAITPFGGSPDNVTLYGESYGSLAVESLIHSPLSSPSSHSNTTPPLFHRAILQSQNLGAPLFSTPETLADKTFTYNSLLANLNLTTLKELQQVPWKDLIAAYQKSNPRNGLPEVGMVDGIFFPADWRKEFVIPGPVLVGNTAAEGTVVELVLASTPATDPRPGASTFLTSLSALLPSAKAKAILDAYGISTAISAEEAGEAMQAIIEDVIWYIPTEEFILRSRKRGLNVREYSFNQLQPFGGPFQGTPAHAVDLAYLHGRPEIFAGVKNPEIEEEMQRAMQETWILFANGVKDGPEAEREREQVKVFGPEGKVREVRKDTFLKDLRRGEKWGALEALAWDEKMGLVVAVMGFWGSLVGKG